ncbi:MAG: ABC transporter ATP-binding protein/permease [Oscillospiraceae bacterium]|jgi:putative ABC transport system permease protein|nr:ABC transporter ATP-binding protein/permease [Oscillospiraceae bacterium]
MLELKNIKKTYKVGEFETVALNGISVAFREREFVAILGASGSGKTTCLNIIGGLDRYDEGEMNIKGKNTHSFKDRDWDAYRNNSIGFVFQSYNLITHLSIVANVELGMTLSGVSKNEKHKRAIEVLEQVGLKDHLHKNPNQLSGGQMQRVAIARALANNPEILLCDEPTGALDSATSKQIMDLIRELSKERLVIMVTHNAEIADAYAERIIRFEDGVISSDTNPHTERDKPDMFNLKKTAMRFVTALNLSGNNILTKKGRTFLTAFASSIGIIGIAVIMSLSNGFQMQIDKFQEDALSEFPIIIMNSTTEVDREAMQTQRNERINQGTSSDNSAPPTEIRVYDPSRFIITHENNFTDEYMNYIETLDPSVCSSIGYLRLVGMNVLRRDDGEAAPITFPTLVSMFGSSMSADETTSLSAMANMGLTSYPRTLGDGQNYLERNYELLAGEYPTEPTDLIMIIGNSGRISVATLSALGFDVDRETIPFDEVLNTELKLITNDDYYTEIKEISDIPADMLPGGTDAGDYRLDIDIKEIPSGTTVADALAMFGEALPDEAAAQIPEEYLTAVIFQTDEATTVVGENGELAAVLAQSDGVVAVLDPEMNLITTYPEIPDGVEMPEGGGASGMFGGDARYFIPSADYDAMWNSEDSVTLKITGIVRLSADSSIGLLSNGLAYGDDLCELVIELAQASDIVKAQTEQLDSVFPTTAILSDEQKEAQKKMLLRVLGSEAVPYGLMLYPSSFENKDALLEYLDEWNDTRTDDKDRIEYTDLAGELLSFMSEIISAITVVLIAFAAISLVVSLIMISIITYVSVLERTKEIGILRALGARKKDITRVFNAETFIIGACSGLLGILIAYALTFPINAIIEDMTNLPNVAQLNILHVIGLLVLSTALTVLGGYLPARMASKKDAVEALRSE